MDASALRLLIKQKLQDGRLPHSSITRVWSGPSDGETCDACELRITKDQSVTQVTLTDDRGARPALPFHVVCFHLWDVERCAV
jgi:hypothetical protein